MQKESPIFFIFSCFKKKKKVKNQTNRIKNKYNAPKESKLTGTKYHSAHITSQQA
jgi:hypothetical protein